MSELMNCCAEEIGARGRPEYYGKRENPCLPFRSVPKSNIEKTLNFQGFSGFTEQRNNGTREKESIRKEKTENGRAREQAYIRAYIGFRCSVRSTVPKHKKERSKMEPTPKTISEREKVKFCVACGKELRPGDRYHMAKGLRGEARIHLACAEAEGLIRRRKA